VDTALPPNETFGSVDNGASLSTSSGDSALLAPDFFPSSPADFLVLYSFSWGFILDLADNISKLRVDEPIQRLIDIDQ
jgi:hypothetical protein